MSNVTKPDNTVYTTALSALASYYYVLIYCLYTTAHILYFQPLFILQIAFAYTRKVLYTHMFVSIWAPRLVQIQTTMSEGRASVELDAYHSFIYLISITRLTAQAWNCDFFVIEWFDFAFCLILILLCSELPITPYYSRIYCDLLLLCTVFLYF